eukprot:10958-Eustigmatos_ZCMA.PRE.1
MKRPFNLPSVTSQHFDVAASTSQLPAPWHAKKQYDYPGCPTVQIIHDSIEQTTPSASIASHNCPIRTSTLTPS